MFGLTGVVFFCALQEGQNPMMNRKVFIGRCTEDISHEDLRSYFSQFGEVVDVFIPKPFRAFAFVSFADAEVAQSLCGEDHIIRGTSVHISSAAPKVGSADKPGGPKPFGFGQGGFGNQGGFGRGGPGQMKANGDGSLPNNMGMNLFNSAMMAAAQAMLSGQQGGFNMGGGGHNQQGGSNDQGNQGLSNTGYGGGGMGGQQQSSANNSFWGNDTSNTGSYTGWGGRGGGWN